MQFAEFFCSRCNTKHKARACPAYGKQCAQCKLYGHFQVACKRKSKKYNNQVHALKSNDHNNQEEQLDEQLLANNFEDFEINSLEVLNIVEDKELFADLLVNNTLIRFKVDTGSPVNIVPEFMVNELANRTLQETNVQFEAFGGGKVPAVGRFTATCSKNNITSMEEFYVCKTSMALLGLKTILKLKIVNVNESILTLNKDLLVGKKDDFINKYKDVFSGLGRFPGLCKLKVKEGATPKANPSRRVAMSLKEKLKATLDEYVKNQIIVPCDEPCEWVSNLVCVEKTSGKLRLCIDPQELNRNLLRDYYEIPTLDEVGFALSGKKYFCVLDIKDGFHHMVLDAESSKLCSFSTPFGTYQYLRAPFGLNCITEMFSKRVNQYFGNIPGVFIYVDDIICSANSIEELHLILEKIMSVARINNIKFNPSKLQYCVKEVKYVGSIFSEGMIKPDPDRIRSIVETKSPRTKKELMSYLGMLNFIRNHIPNLSDMISPLRALLKNDVIFEWKKCHEDVFLKIRSIIASNTILTQFDFQKPI